MLRKDVQMGWLADRPGQHGKEQTFVHAAFPGKVRQLFPKPRGILGHIGNGQTGAEMPP